MRPGGGQGGRGQEYPALEESVEAGKPGKPCRGRYGIVFPSHAPFCRDTHEVGAGAKRGRIGGESRGAGDTAVLAVR